MTGFQMQNRWNQESHTERHAGSQIPLATNVRGEIGPTSSPSPIKHFDSGIEHDCSSIPITHTDSAMTGAVRTFYMVTINDVTLHTTAERYDNNGTPNDTTGTQELHYIVISDESQFEV
ncbi:hypothetical protein TNCV_949071 [Trichonephila clavipes]|nr:hypothetical protein TNCV_949071 [Trichonephila clavipes]